MTPSALLVNGRFATQNLSGVQRFAVEITRALWQLCPDRIRVLAPPGPLVADVPGIAQVGRRGGQVWEQSQLPRFCRGGLLVNLANTAPVAVRRQLVVIHDTGVFITPEAYSWKFRAWYRLMQALIIQGGAALVTVSEFSRAGIAEIFGISLSRIQVIGEGADHMERIAADPGVLTRHGLRVDGFVLAAGNLAAHKNLPALGRLAEALAQRGVPLVITGAVGGKVFNAAGAALPQPARYIGRVTDGELKSLYQGAACFVFPSRYEGFGLPPIEAMACACPVVAGDIPALRETCGDAALYGAPEDPDEWMARVLALFGDQALGARLRAAGLARAAVHRWDRAAAQLLSIIDGME